MTKEEAVEYVRKKAKYENKLELFDEILNMISPELNLNQLVFIIAVYLNGGRVYKINDKIKISKDEVMDLYMKDVIINEPKNFIKINNKKKYLFDDITLSDYIIEKLDEMFSGDVALIDAQRLTDEFIKEYPFKSDAGFTIGKIAEMDKFVKSYILGIKTDAEREGLSIEEYHQKVIRIIRDNKSSINIKITDFVNAKNWNQFETKIVKQNNSKIG